MTFFGLNNEQEAVYEIVEPSNLNTIKCSSTLANHLVLGQMELHKLKIGSEIRRAKISLIQQPSRFDKLQLLNSEKVQHFPPRFRCIF